MTVGTDSERQGLAERPKEATPRKARVPPGQQEFGPLLRQQPDALQQANHLVPEKKLCRMLIDESDRNPLALLRPNPTRHQGMDMRMPVRQVARALNDSHHPRPYLVAGRLTHQLVNSLPGSSSEPAEQLPVVQEVRPQRDREEL